MKRIAAAFTALFVLASCLMAGGSIYMHAHRNDLEITGEVLYGERAMASGVEVRQSVLIDGHPNWEVSYSPAAASSRPMSMSESTRATMGRQSV